MHSETALARPTILRRTIAGVIALVLAWAGTGAQSATAATPQASTGSTAAADPEWTSIGGSSLHTCAVTLNGSVFCWGYNSVGQLGNGSRLLNIIPSPVPGITGAVGLAVGGSATCALLQDHTIRCWGWNGEGAVGTGAFNDTPVLQPVAVTQIDSAVAVTGGNRHSCALLADHTIRCWGAGADGQLGNGGTANSATPVVVTGIDTGIAVAAGGAATCALLQDHTIRCWGGGQAVPVAVTGITTAVDVSVGNEHTCALLEDRTVRCWGWGTWGQLGNGASESSAVPVPVTGIDDAVAVAAAGNRACAIVADGSVRCWGAGHGGQLGNGAIASSPVPVTVTDIDSATSIGGGFDHTCVVLEDRTARCWGGNERGQVGDRTVVNRSTPVPLNFVPDTAAPVATAPVVAYRTGATLAGKRVPVRVTFPATDGVDGTGIDHYDLQWIHGTYTKWDQVEAPSSDSYAMRIASSSTVRFRVRAYDRAGHVTGWVVGPTLRSRLTQDTSSMLRYRGGWSTRFARTYLGGSAHWTKRAGAKVTFSFTGRAVALITTKSNVRGKFKVYVDGVYRTTVDQYSGGHLYRVPVWQQHWAGVGKHTVKLVALGTPGRPRVDIDAFAVLR